MRRFIRDFVARRRSRTESRRQAELRRAAREKENRDTNEGSIWKSGKGGGHHDRIQSRDASGTTGGDGEDPVKAIVLDEYGTADVLNLE